jgi:hypothetical protein
MSATKTDPGFYGNDTDMICVMPSSRIWLVGRPDEEHVLRLVLIELPRDVETDRDTFPRDFNQGHRRRIKAASDESI